jgi:hypothetical protein
MESIGVKARSCKLVSARPMQSMNVLILVESATEALELSLSLKLAPSETFWSPIKTK